jgi:hypothetical protein
MTAESCATLTPIAVANGLSDQAEAQEGPEAGDQ